MILIFCNFKSLIASLIFSLSLNPESRGITNIFLSPISSKANCMECNKEFPNSLYSPLSGASKPIFN